MKIKVKKSSKGKLISSFIIGILLMFSIVISVLSVFTKTTVLNKNTYINILEEREVYRQAYELLESNIEYALVVNNISSEVKDGVISIDEVREEIGSIINEVIHYLLTGENTVNAAEVDTYANRFNKNLDDFIRDNAIHIDNNLKNDIDKLKSDVRQIIKNELEIINLDIINNSSSLAVISKLTSIFASKLYLLPIIVPIILIILLAFIWKGDYVKLTKWIGSGILAGGMFIVMLFFSGYISEFYTNIIIDIPYLKDFMVTIIKTYLLTLTKYGVIISVIGAVLIIPQIKQYIKRSKMKKKKVGGNV